MILRKSMSKVKLLITIAAIANARYLPSTRPRIPKISAKTGVTSISNPPRAAPGVPQPGGATRKSTSVAGATRESTNPITPTGEPRFTGGFATGGSWSSEFIFSGRIVHQQLSSAISNLFKSTVHQIKIALMAICRHKKNLFGGFTIRKTLLRFCKS